MQSEEASIESLTRRGHITKRHISHGAIVGIVVACVVLVLLGLCLYPMIIRRFRRPRPQDDAAFDTEHGVNQTNEGTALDEKNTQPSSSDSFKKEKPSRGDHDQHKRKESSRGMSFTDGDLSRQIIARVDTSVATNNIHDPTLLSGGSDAYSPFGKEFFPSTTADPDPGVLKGTNADYYSEHIPSALFGMPNEAPAEEGAESPRSTLSRNSSLKFNVLQMIRGRTSWDRTKSGASKRGSTDHSYTNASRVEEAIPIEKVLHEEETTESPATVKQLPFSPPAAVVAVEAPVEGAKTPPQSPPTNKSLHGSPSPPLNPAPGTVNPMDIMPATTHTETSYQTEQTLNNFNSSPPMSDTDTAMFNNYTYETIITSPSPPVMDSSLGQPFFVMDSLPFNGDEMYPKHDFTEQGDVLMEDFVASNNLSGVMSNGSDRRASMSMTSEVSTPFLGGHQFTDPSSHNTPATQFDSPSSHSMNGSDFRQSDSQSPQPAANIPAPQNGRYYCSHCDRSFTQHHKLNHHQRYHDKTHVCEYPGCGLRFGTKTHLQRHINDRHERKKKYHCAVSGCDFSRSGGKAFPRKDNWKRHMMKIHNILQQDLPEPEAVEA